MIHEAAPERPLTFSFLVLFGILAVVQGSPSRKLRDVLPGTQTLSLGLSQLPAPVPGPAHPIGCRRTQLPSDAWRDFCDWLPESLVRRVRLQGGEEGAESSPATQHLQPDDRSASDRTHRLLQHLEHISISLNHLTIC